MDAFAPRTFEEALEVKAAHHEAVPVMGGTDVIVDVNFGRLRPPSLLDLSRIDELSSWHRTNGSVFLGAGMTFARIAREMGEFRPLAEAALTVGSPQIRNRATIGGNLATASPAGDGIPPLAAWDAQIVIASVGGRRRRIRWDEFLLGPKRTVLEHDELIAGVEWKVADGPGSFAKIGPRNANVIAVAGVCVQLDEPSRSVRVALGSVGPTVLRAHEAESLAAEAIPWDEPGEGLPQEALTAFGDLVARAATPIDDLRGSADFRRHVVAQLSRRLLTWTLEDRRC